MSMQSNEVQSLKRENEQLRDRLAVLEETFGANLRAPSILNLTRMQERIFCVLYRRGFCERDTILAAMYGVDMYDRNSNSLEVILVSLRRKLAPHNIEIKSSYGRGYEMPEASQKIAKLLLEYYYSVPLVAS